MIRIQVRHQVLGSKGQGHGDAKNVENSAQFWIIFNIDCKYLRNQTRYGKPETNLIDSDFCGFGKKLAKFGPLTKKLHVLVLTHISSKFSVISDYFRLGSQTSPEWMVVSCWRRHNSWRSHKHHLVLITFKWPQKELTEIKQNFITFLLKSIWAKCYLA